ncbi:hypothetical protein [Burkholderia vietnamiensis]|uniref:hypothetical protein n=1 Tax=Burkholderia vietnamiensis TaxID=60552 RepID=UPI002651B6EF|nr:hypothetical protein [Burkholderia vietnamiensis]MDN8037427.1 hypothetical protein [Burkholderia vietnamiensis]
MIKDVHEIYQELGITEETMSVEIQIDLARRITHLDEITRANQVNQNVYQMAKEIQMIATSLRWALHRELHA